MFQKKLLVSALAGMSLMASGAVMAGPINVELDYTGPSFGSFENGTANGSGTLAGQFDLNTRNGDANSLIEWPSGPLEAFCIDLDTSLITSWTGYELKTANQYFSGSPDIVTNLDKLYSTHFDKVIDSTTSAAFQLGIWEILADTTTGYDLAAGDFQASGYGNDADDTAGTWLDNLGSATGYQFLVLESTATSPSSQDLLVVNPPPSQVPEPGTLALLGLGLAGLAVRKRKA